MTVTVYAICWNEIFLLPHFFKHYEWADKIIIYDNGSDDGSQEFVNSQSKGELRFYDSKGKQDNEVMRQLKNNCWKGDTSDWVIVCDMDEFLIGHEKLEEYLDQICIFECKQWEMISEEIPEDFKSVTLKFQPRRGACKSLCFSPKIKEINFGLGAHRSHPIPNNKINHVLEYNHYSCLSEDYVVQRWQRYANRLSKNDFDRKLTTNYLWEEQKIRDFFRDRLCLVRPNT